MKPRHFYSISRLSREKLTPGNSWLEGLKMAQFSDHAQM